MTDVDDYASSSSESMRSFQLPVADTPDPVITDPRASAADALAQTVRHFYVLCFRDTTGNAGYGSTPIPRWDGGEDGYARRTKSIWPRIAAQILQVGAHPLDYVRAQFYGRVNPRPPAPNQLLGPAAIEAWRSFYSERRLLDELAREFDNDRRSLFGTVLAYTAGPKWPQEKALRYALANTTTVSATPLYRYCAAWQADYLDCVEYYRERALLQLLFHRDEYAQVYGTTLPMTLRHAAGDLCRWLGLA